MNAFLAQLFSFLNALVGFLIVITGVLVGYALMTGSTINGYNFGEAAPAAIFSVTVAILIAVLMCGLIALLAEIERHLRELKELQTESNKYKKTISERVEPKLR